MPVCPRCGSQANYNFCPDCGMSIPQSTAHTPPSRPQSSPGKTSSALVIALSLITAIFAGAYIYEWRENARINEANERLTEDLELADDEINELNNANAELTDENEGYLGEISYLSANVTELENILLTMNNDLSLLEDEVNDLEDERALLLNQLVDIENQNTDLLALIEDKNNTISDLSITIQDLSDEIELWLYIYELRIGHHPYDLVTPDDAAIINKSQELLGANADGVLTWDDMDVIYQWVHANIEYSYDQYMMEPDYMVGYQEFWQYPAETLDRGEGDCDDMTNLALSLMLAEQNVGWLFGCKVYFSPSGGHAAIFVNVANDTLVVIDPTWGWRSPVQQSEPNALSEWANYGGFSGVNLVWSIYDDTSETEFSSLTEFYNWF